MRGCLAFACGSGLPGRVLNRLGHLLLHRCGVCTGLHWLRLLLFLREAEIRPIHVIRFFSGNQRVGGEVLNGRQLRFWRSRFLPLAAQFQIRQQAVDFDDFRRGRFFRGRLKQRQIICGSALAGFNRLGLLRLGCLRFFGCLRFNDRRHGLVIAQLWQGKVGQVEIRQAQSGRRLRRGWFICRNGVSLRFRRRLGRSFKRRIHLGRQLRFSNVNDFFCGSCRLRRRFFGCHWHGRQRNTLLPGAHGFGADAERPGLPMARLLGGNGLHPVAESQHGLGSQGAQLGAGGLLLGQPGVHELLHGPGRFTELVQPHHAGAALERVVGAAQRGLLLHVVRALLQRLNGLLAVLDHFTRFFQKDVEQVVIHLRLGGSWRRHGSRCGAGQGGELVHCALEALGVVGARGARSLLGGIGQRRLVIQRRREGNLLQLARQCVRGAFGRSPHVVDQVGNGGLRAIIVRSWQRWRFVCALQQVGRRSTAHDRAQLARLLVQGEQLFRQHGLVAEHVDQKTQRPQAVAQPFEVLRVRLLDVFAIVLRDVFDNIAHARHGLRCLIQPQHQQHAAHLHHLRQRRTQWRAVGHVAEELIELLLDFAQRHAQLADHGAQRLAVADAAVKLFHPGVQRLLHAAMQDGLKTVSKLPRPRGEHRIARAEIHEGRFQKQHGRGRFHRQVGGRNGGGLGHVTGHMNKGVCQRLAMRVQAAQRIGHKAELVHAALEPRQIAARQARPCFLERVNAAARLRQHRRVKQAEDGRLVIDRLAVLQAPCRADGFQYRGFFALRLGLRAEKQQVLREPFGNGALASRQRGVLNQNARGRALDIHVRLEQAMPQCLEKAR